MRAYILLDRSGSMATEWVETIGSINGYVEKLATEDVTKNVKVDVIAFDKPGYTDGEISYVKIREKCSASDWRSIQPSEISPRGTTPLNDAIGKLCSDVRDDDPRRAMIIIMTDGHENSSFEYSQNSAKKALDDLRKRDYEVVFLGANFRDVEKQSVTYGGTWDKTINTTSRRRAETMYNLAAASVNYATTGAGINLSADEKKLAESE